jgi:hypothetical protein
MRSLLALGVLAVPFAARAQDMEPRAFSNAPVGMNFLIVGYAFTQGGLSFDPSVPVTNEHLETSNALLAYARVLDLWGMSAKFDAIMPFTRLSGSADFAGQPVNRLVSGFGDVSFRLSVNFYGAPALTLPEFAAYKQDLIVGASLRVFAPVGQYDPTRAVNLGTNRWSFNPMLGVSKALDPVTLEVTAGARFYTDNTNFLRGNTRSQDPIYSIEGHAIYSFASGIWASADITYFTGGRTAINGEAGNDLQQNWRLGATLTFPLNTRQSIKLYGSSGVAARTGNSYNLIGIAFQYRWGGGL